MICCKGKQGNPSNKLIEELKVLLVSKSNMFLANIQNIQILKYVYIATACNVLSNLNGLAITDPRFFIKIKKNEIHLAVEVDEKTD